METARANHLDYIALLRSVPDFVSRPVAGKRAGLGGGERGRRAQAPPVFVEVGKQFYQNNTKRYNDGDGGENILRNFRETGPWFNSHLCQVCTE